jgi:uncharacterized protein YgbK (DUF1537 family)
MVGCWALMAAPRFRMVTIIADDLTGACDTGCLFAGHGPVGVVAEPALATSDRAAITVDTESRPLPPEQASAAVRAIAARLHGRLGAGPVFKKIDSTMRGSVGAEIGALLADGPFSGALVCPVFPAQHRIVRHGRLLVDAIPVHASPIGRDPSFRASTSEVVALLGSGPAPVIRLDLDAVRAGCEKIAHVLEQQRGAIVAADAETDADLASLAEAALSVPGTLAAGSAGLGRALSHALGWASPAPVAAPAGTARLIVVGSVHPASRAHLEALAQAGVATVVADARGHADPAPAIAALASGRPAVVASAPAPADRLAVARSLAQAVVAILERARPDLVAVTGGDTAYALIQALRPERFDLLGAPADGLALGRVVMEQGREIALLTKAGGFGAASLFTATPGGTP